MAVYSFVRPLEEAKFCGVPSCVFDRLDCAVDEKISRSNGLEINADNQVHVHFSSECRAEGYIREADEPLENLAKFKHLGTTLTNQNYISK
jgi:hypothetical protein